MFGLNPAVRLGAPAKATREMTSAPASGAEKPKQNRRTREVHVSMKTDQVCLLAAVEVRRWEYHGQAPARCSLNKHRHVSEDEAHQMCRNGGAQLAMICGMSRLIQTDVKKGWQPRMSAGYTVNQMCNS